MSDPIPTDRLRARLKQTRPFGSLEESAIVALMTAGLQVRQEMDRLCEGHGITGDQYNVLRILRGVHPDGHARCDIATRLVSRAPDVTRLLDRLERRGLVERVRSAEDRRLSISRITPAGLALLERMVPEQQELWKRTLARLTKEEVRELVRLCSEVVE